MAERGGGLSLLHGLFEESSKPEVAGWWFIFSAISATRVIEANARSKVLNPKVSWIASRPSMHRRRRGSARPAITRNVSD